MLLITDRLMPIIYRKYKELAGLCGKLKQQMQTNVRTCQIGNVSLRVPQVPSCPPRGGAAARVGVGMLRVVGIPLLEKV